MGFWRVFCKQVNSSFNHDVKEALPKVWLPNFKDDTPIILDLSDMAKPLAKKNELPGNSS